MLIFVLILPVKVLVAAHAGGSRPTVHNSILIKMVQTKLIKEIAEEVGFDLCGITRVRNFDAEQRFFTQWLEHGMHGGLTYLERNIDKRFDASLLVPGARSVIVCAVAYKNAFSIPADTTCDYPQIASYAVSRDYHDTIKYMLRLMTDRLQQLFGSFAFRTFVDTAPLAEKLLAADAGLGFIGRNKLLVSPRFGSYLLLGEIVSELEPDTFDTHYAGPGCGNCQRCEQNCPVGALTPVGLDARRCISRLTVEHNAASVAECHGWIFGCDECQRACPYNDSAPLATNRLFEPVVDPRTLSREAWFDMSDEQFAHLFGQTPMSRSNLAKIKLILQQEQDS